MASPSEESKFQFEAMGLLARDKAFLDRHFGVSSVTDLEITEVGTGNLNFIFRVVGPKGTMVVKKAPPYIRLVGKSWPLPASRIRYERDYILAANKAGPKFCPKVFLSDLQKCIVAMEDMSGMDVWRDQIRSGDANEFVGEDVGPKLARVHFRTSDFGQSLEQRHEQIRTFFGNRKLIETTEQVFFKDPFYDAPLNKWKERAPDLKHAVEKLQNDTKAKAKAYILRDRFLNSPQALLHGDLHTGSIFADSGKTSSGRVKAVAFDCEFAFYGPMGFDVGQLLGNMALGSFSQCLYMKASGSQKENAKRLKCAYSLIKQIESLWDSYVSAFKQEFKEGGDSKGESSTAKRMFPGSDPAFVEDFLRCVWTDTIGFASLAMIRRIVGIADAPEMRVQTSTRWRVEAVALSFAHRQFVGVSPGEEENADVFSGCKKFCRALETAVKKCCI